MTQIDSRLTALQSIQDLLHDNPQDAVQHTYGDEQEVRDCLTDTVTYFHENLTPTLRSHITDKWGIEPATIDHLKIGFTTPPPDTDRNPLFTWLRNRGHSDWAILRAGLAGCGGLSYVLDTDPIQTGPDTDMPAELTMLSGLYSISINTHTYDTPALVDRTQLDYHAIYRQYADSLPEQTRPVSDSFWWDDRIVFPYRNADGDISYFIGRQTPTTTDQVYDNDITDWTEKNTRTLTVQFTTDDSGRLVFNPPAVAVTPGTRIDFQNEIGQPVTLSVEYSTDQAWREGRLSALQPQPCPSGGTYQYAVETGAGTVRGAVLATDSLDSDQLIRPITDWLTPAHNWTPDIAKYLKLTKNRAEVHPTAVTEPVYGIHTVIPDHSLLITEGITDAIVAHQHDIPCISPATTHFKQTHHEKILNAATQASNVVVAMDNDANDAGLNGALTVTTLLQNEGIPATIAELPRPDHVDSYDVVDFLKDHSIEQFHDCLTDSIPPQQHPNFDPAKHDPGRIHSSSHTEATNSSSRSPQSSPSQTPAQAQTQPQTHANQADTQHGSTDGTALFDMTLYDAAEPGALPGTEADVIPETGTARGSNPLTGRDGNSFVVMTPQLAYEHHGTVKATYNPVTWLCCKVGTRNATNPEGPISDKELWEVWYYANTNAHVTHPDDGDWESDPVPRRAMHYLAWHENIYPPSSPEKYADCSIDQLPRDAYLAVLETIMSEYSVNPGRTP